MVNTIFNSSFQNGLIYKVTSEGSDKIYIGCTTQILEERLEQHKSDKKNACYRYRSKEPKIELIVNALSECKKSLEKVEKCPIEYYYEKSGDKLRGLERVFSCTLARNLHTS